MSVLELAVDGLNTMTGINNAPVKPWKYQEKEKCPGGIVDIEFAKLDEVVSKVNEHST